MSLYVTLHELKTYKGVLDSDADDARLFTAVRSATRAWDRWTFRRFDPLRATRQYDHVDGTTLRLGADLLEPLEVTTQNGAVTIETDEYYPMCGRRYDLLPYDRLVLRTDKGVLFSFSGTPQKANAVTGIWGYHPDYAHAWEDSGDTVQNESGLDGNGTSLLVAEAGGLDWYGFAPRFQIGQLLKVEDEFLYLRALSAETNTLTVQRGANGTTAATHAKDTPIYTWRVYEDCWEAVRELAAYLYDLKDSQVYDVTATPETGQMVLPKGVPVQVKLAVQAYRRY